MAPHPTRRPPRRVARFLPVGIALLAGAVAVPFLVGPGTAAAPETQSPSAPERLRGAIEAFDAGDVDGAVAELERLAAERKFPRTASLAALRLSVHELSTGHPEAALCRLEDPKLALPAELAPVGETFRARALVALGRPGDAATRLEFVLRGGNVPRSAERLALAMLEAGPDAATAGAPLSADVRFSLASRLAASGSTDEVRGRALLGTLLPALRESGDWPAYRAALGETLERAPLSVLRVRGVPRTPTIAADLAVAARDLTPAARLSRARQLAAGGDATAALAELARIDRRMVDPVPLAEVRALEAELLVRLGRNRDALAATSVIEAPDTPLRDRLTLARAQALLGSAAVAPQSAPRRGKKKPAAPPRAVLPSPARDEALALLAGLDRDDAEPAVRRKAIELSLEAHLASGVVPPRAQELFLRKESLFPESTVGREAIWNRAFPTYREGNPLDAMPLFDLLARSGETATARRGAYWGARARLSLGRVDEAGETFSRLAAVPAVDFYARHASRRLVELGREIPTVPWTLVTSDDAALSRQMPPRARALEEVGLWAEALEEVPDSPDLPRAVKIRRTVLLAATGERDRAMHQLKQVHPEIQTAAAAAIPERELRLFYPIGFEEYLVRNARRFDLDLPGLAALVRQESGFRTTVRSSAGAQGIMQIMPSTAKLLGRRLYAAPVPAHRLSDPELSIEMGSYYLRDLTDRLGGEWELALAGYNAGPGRVSTVKKRWPDGDVDLWVESLPFAETRDYVKKIVLYASVYRKLYPQLERPEDRGPAGGMVSAGGR